jgi:hypothetical protein
MHDVVPSVPASSYPPKTLTLSLLSGAAPGVGQKPCGVVEKSRSLSSSSTYRSKLVPKNTTMSRALGKPERRGSKMFNG